MIKLFKAIIFILILSSSDVWAFCAPGLPLNPVTDIAWHGIFPIKIGGVPIGGIELPDPGDPANSPVCACPFPPPIFVRIGIPISYWEPSRFIETVRDPFCFPSLGIAVMPPGAALSGTYAGEGNEQAVKTFAQAHYFIYPPFALLGMFVDWVCVEHSDFDVGYLTEVDPLWNDDLLSAMIQPEALLFANPITQIACMADSVTANAGMPLKWLFWCMGSWGSSYPMTGHIPSERKVQSNAAAAARLIYKLNRQGIMHDTAINLCMKTPTPIWVKSNYRLQMAKPINGLQIIPIGRSGILWEAAMNPPFMGDNFLFMVFRKRACCAF